MDKQRSHLDSECQIGIGSTSHKISNCSSDVSTGGQKELAELLMLAAVGIGGIFACNARTSSAVDKQRQQRDLVH